MGSQLSRGSRTSPSNLKLESQKIVEFSGRFEEWQKWKNRTQCAFDGSGYESILLDRGFATQRMDMNRIVYSQLSVATSGGTAYHLVKQFESEKDGHAAWSALCEWYDGDTMKAETADTIRNKLGSYHMHNGDSASYYINNFLTSYQELNEIPGEALSESHALSMFLKGIKDTDYETFVEIQRNKSEEGLVDAIVALRKKERSIVEKRKERRIAKSRQRRRREEIEEGGDSDVEYIRPTKIRRVKEKSYGHIDTIRVVRNGYLSVPDEMWARDLSEDEKKFVISYNARIRYRESTDNMDVPSKFQAALKDQRQASGKEEKTLRRKIGFNLGKGKDDEDEQEEG